MRKIKLYIAISLNGMIAKSDGGLDWLENMPNPENTDYGYSEFYKSIDTTIQGYKTYEIILNRGIEIPSTDKINYVFTRKKEIEDTEYIHFVKENHMDFTRQLKKKDGKDIWLMGGGQINTAMLKENLIDEIQIFVMPIIIESGIKLFESDPKDQMLTLVNSRQYKSGVVEMNYIIDHPIQRV